MNATERQHLLDVYREALPADSKSKNVARAKLFLDWIGDRQISAENVRAYFEHAGETFASGTLANDWAIVRRMCRVNSIPWPFQWGEGPTVQEADVFAPGLPNEDIRDMIDVCRGRIQPQDTTLTPGDIHTTLLCIATVWGLRRRELCELTADHVNLPGQQLYITTAKSGRARYHHIPAFIIPHLTWDFGRNFSDSGMSAVFADLKRMIGLTIEDIGWHAIRRACIREARAAGIDAEHCDIYYRYKRSGRDMVRRYATSQVVGRFQNTITLGQQDLTIDTEFEEKHPYIRLWK